MGGSLRAVELCTEGMPDCLTAGARPVFGWQLEKTHGGRGQTEETWASRAQTGYEVQVLGTAGDEVWSSGHIASSRCFGLPYEGPELADDSDYSWRVRVMDAANQPGPWSGAKVFSTGLNGSRAGSAGHGKGGWQAEWIHRKPGGRGPLDLLGGVLRVAGSPWLPWPEPGVPESERSGILPTSPVRTVMAVVRPQLGLAGILIRSSGAGTGLLVELGHAGDVVLREAPLWEIPCASAPDTRILAAGQLGQDDAPDACPGGWRTLQIHDDGTTIAVILDGVEILAAAVLPSAVHGIAFHQGPRSQAEYARIEVRAGVEQSAPVLLSRDFVQQETDPLRDWPTATNHRQPDEWTRATHCIPLRGDVVRARLYVAACHRATVRINGTECLTTTSFGYPGEGYYDGVDVTAVLHGADQAGLDVLLHWYGPGQGRAAAHPGLLLQLNLEYADGRREAHGTGSGWQVSEGPYRQAGYRNDEGDTVEYFDATAAPDATSSPALSYGPHPSPEFPAVHPRRTVVAARPVTAARLLTAADGTLVADFGKVIPGRPDIDFATGIAGRTVMLRAGYQLTPDGRVDAGRTASQNTDMSFPYVQPDGPHSYRANIHLGFRYLEFPGLDASDIVRAGAVVVHGKHPVEGSFSSSDATLNAVFALLRDSALHGVQEQFVDTPTREKGQFLADAVNISYGTMALFGEHAFTAQALREFAWSGARYWHRAGDRGHFNAVYPNGDGKREIPDFSLMLPEWAEEYYLRTGDLALIREILPALCDAAAYPLRHIPEEGPTAGLVTRLGGGSGPYLHGIVDWPAPGRFGYDMECAAKTTVNAQAVSALQSAARLCRVAGSTQEAEGSAASFEQRAHALSDAIRRRLRVDGVMVDGLHADGTPSTHASQHAASFPLSLGITAPEFAQADAGQIAAMGMQQGPLTVHRLVRALLRQGKVDAVLDLLTSSGHPGFARLLERGATFTWEAWDLDEGSDYSQSHAWSASILKEILEYLLGVRFTAPGGTAVVIEPPLCRLESANGSIPCTTGMIHVSWSRASGSMVLDYTLPAGVTAEVRLPSGTAPGTYQSAERLP